MATNPYQNIPGWDPRTGMPKKKQKPNPYGAITGSLAGPGFGGGGFGGGQIPGGGYGGGFGGNLGPISTPSYTPDYKTLIAKALEPLNLQLGAEGSADAATRNAQLVRGIGQFGEQFDPEIGRASCRERV